MELKGKYFTLNSYVFLIEGKKRGALYDLHQGVIYPLPESAKYVMSMCERHIPIKAILEEISAEEDRQMALEYMDKIEQYDFGKYRNSVDGYTKTHLNLSPWEERELMALAVELPLAPGEDKVTVSQLLDVIKEAKVSCRLSHVNVIPSVDIDSQNVHRFMSFLEKLKELQVQNIEIYLLISEPQETLFEYFVENKDSIKITMEERRITGDIKSKIVDVLLSRGVRVDSNEGLALKVGRLSPEVLKRHEVSSHIFSTGYGIFRKLRVHDVNANRLYLDKEGIVYPCIHDTGIKLGNIHDKSIRDIVYSKEVNQLWTLTKDHIEKCKDCEYRYACMNTRTFRQSLEDRTSAPANCPYDPIEGKWLNIDQSISSIKLKDVSEQNQAQLLFNESRYFRIISHQQRPFPTEYTSILDSVIDEAIQRLGINEWTQKINYYFYPSTEAMRAEINPGIDISGEMEVIHQVGKRHIYQISTVFPCHTHEILHAVFHSLNAYGNLFVKEGCATTLGFTRGSEADLNIDKVADLFKSNLVTRMLDKNGTEVKEQNNLMMIRDEIGLISGPLRHYKIVHEIAAWVLKMRNMAIDMTAVFNINQKFFTEWIYEVGGSFFLYLLDTYGTQKFCDFYKSAQSPAHFECHFGKSIHDAEIEWKNYVSQNYIN